MRSRRTSSITTSLSDTLDVAAGLRGDGLRGGEDLREGALREGDLERRRMTSSSTTDDRPGTPPPKPKHVIMSQRRRRKPATEPRTIPATVPGVGPELSPEYVAGMTGLAVVVTVVCRRSRDARVLESGIVLVGWRGMSWDGSRGARL